MNKLASAFIGVMLFWTIASSTIAASLSEQRTLYTQAEAALQQKNWPRYSALIAELGDYPLVPHLEARRLADPGVAIEQLTAFLDRYGKRRPANGVRGELLDRLAERGDWKTYLRYFGEENDSGRVCDRAFAQLRIGETDAAYAAARTQWMNNQTLPSRCNRLFDAWRQTPGFDRDLLWVRYGVALETGQSGVTAELRRLFRPEEAAAAEFWRSVHSAPRLGLQCGAWHKTAAPYGRILAHAVIRLAAEDPWLAQQLWNSQRSRFQIPTDVIAKVEKKLGLTLAAKRHPVASAYLNPVPDALADEQLRGWRVRAALTRQHWPLVLSEIQRLNDAEQAKPEWRYWRARAMEQLGDRDEATALYRQAANQRDFFAFLAADRTGQSYVLAGQASPPGKDVLDRLASQPDLAAAREWLARDQAGEARRDWMHAIKSLDRGNLITAAYLARDWNQPHWAIVTAGKAQYWDDLDLRFPLVLRESIERHAQLANLEPAHVYGIVRRESAFDRTARSGANAMGLMQLLPGTAELVARQLGERWRQSDSLYAPDLNLHLGAHFLGQLLAKFDGNLAVAAAAYNAGPGNAKKWLPEREAMPVDIWVETIPFTETREYVAAVLEYVTIYEHRLGRKPTPLSRRLQPVKPSGIGTPAPQAEHVNPIPACLLGSAITPQT